VNEIPRRMRVDMYTPAELAIREAILAVETAGADPLLTDAVVLLDQAKAKVADFVDGVKRHDHESAWVVELGWTESGMSYWGKTIEGLGPTTENLDAIRFARKEDADAIVTGLALDGATVNEHAWCKPAE
jgi:methionine synthase I (cobalamin-dependent)